MITVYWSCLEDEWQRAKPPVEILKHHFAKDCYKTSGMQYCPAFKEALTNLYGIRSLYHYEIQFEGNGVTVPPFVKVPRKPSEEEFFKQHFVPRDVPNKVFSFVQSFLYLCDKDLEMTGNLSPHLEEGDVANRCIATPGRFNIGQWQRGVEFAVKLKDEYDTFKISEDEIFTYTQFHTNEKIEFKQFIRTPKLDELLLHNANMSFNKLRTWPLSSYKSKVKNLIMKEAKSNTL
jgi:hypothetical protein